MSLFSRLNQVDARVRDILAKAKNEQERHLQGLSIAQLYYQVGAYDKARQYIGWYMRHRPTTASAHKLHAQILAALKQPLDALVAWERCFTLDSYQTDAVMAACRLLLDMPAAVAHDASLSTWLSRAERCFPRHAILLRLREHSILARQSAAASGAADNDALSPHEYARQLEEVLSAGVDRDPLDAGTHARLLRVLARSRGDSQQQQQQQQQQQGAGCSDAVRYAVGVEGRRVFCDHIDWQQAVVDVCCQNGDGVCDNATMLTHLSSLDLLISLKIVAAAAANDSSVDATGAPCAAICSLLFRYDQLIFGSVNQLTSIGSGFSLSSADDVELTAVEKQAVIQHHTAQLIFHMASYILLTEMQNFPSGGVIEQQARARDTVRSGDIARALLAAARAIPPEALRGSSGKPSKKPELEWLYNRGACRVVEADTCLSSCPPATASVDNYDAQAAAAAAADSVSSAVRHYCRKSMANEVYKYVFSTCAEFSSGSIKSAFLTQSTFTTTSSSSLHDASSDRSSYSDHQMAPLLGVYAQTHCHRLAELVWLQLNSRAAGQHVSGAVSAAVRLPAAPAAELRLSSSAESLAQLDLLCFLQATVFWCRHGETADKQSVCGVVLPPALSRSSLCTNDQTKWWDSVFGLYTEKWRIAGGGNIGELRQMIVRGLICVRCLARHQQPGQNPSLLMNLADYCQQQRQLCEESVRDSWQCRSLLYLSNAVRILQRLKSASRPPHIPLCLAAGRNATMFELPADLFPVAEKAAQLLDSCSCQLAAGLRDSVSVDDSACGGGDDGSPAENGESGRHSEQRRKQLQRALEAVQSFTSANSSFQRALTLVKLSECVSGSEARDYLRRAKESLYLTLDRLRDETACPSNAELSSQLAAHIQLVEDRLLQDTLLCDANSRVNGDHQPSVVTSSVGMTSSSLVTSTPLRRPIVSGKVSNSLYDQQQQQQQHDHDTTANNTAQSPPSKHIPPSPERISAEIHNLSVTQDAILHLLMERRAGRSPSAGTYTRTSGAGASTPAGSNTVAPAPAPAPVLDVDEVCARVERQLKLQYDNRLAEQERSIATLQKELAELRLEKSREMYNYMASAGQYQAALRNLSLGQFGYAAAAGGSLPATAPVPPQLAPPLTQLHAQAMPMAAPGGVAGMYSGLPLHDNDGSLAASLSEILSTPSVVPFQQQQQQQQLFNTPLVSSSVPCNVTVSVSDPLPSLSQASQNAGSVSLPAVIVPAQHCKSAAVVTSSETAPVANIENNAENTHKFQISLPNQAVLPTVSPFSTADSDKPAFSRVSTLPGIAAPEFSAVNPPCHTSPSSSATASASAACAGGGAGRSPLRARLNSSGSYQEDVEYDPMPDFKPLVCLPELTAATTGEERETCQFSAHCKLYRFVDAEWKERGVGELRLLLRSEDGRARIVMRRNQTHRVCANHFVLPAMELTTMKNQTRAFVWAAKDFSDEQVKDEKMCARFKTDEVAEQFRQAFNQAKNAVKSQPNSASAKNQPKTSTSVSTTAAGAAPVTASVSGAPTISATAAAIPSRVPTSGGFTFNGVSCQSSSRYEDISGDVDEEYDEDSEEDSSSSSEGSDSPPPGRVSCQPEFLFSSAGASAGTGFSFGFGAGSAAAAPSVTAGSGFRFGDPVPPTTATTTAAAPRFRFGAMAAGSGSGSSASVSTVANTTSSTIKLGGFTFTSAPTVVSVSDDKTKTSKAPVFGVSSTSVSTSTAESKPPGPFAGFSFGAGGSVAQSSDVADKQQTSGSGGGGGTASAFMFGAASTAASGAPSLDFSSLASSGAVSSAFHKSDTFTGFTGAGRPLFGSSSATTTATTQSGVADQTDDDVVDNFEPNVDFKPIVDLPDLVDAKTGEENERELFCERAKLFRMDTSSNEWKERGVGNLKILHDPAAGKSRILMRRLQVLKLCANHRITADMQLKPLSSSDRAWVWCATDFADETASRDTLAVKFKTTDLAGKFRQVFESCQKGDIVACNGSATAVVVSTQNSATLSYCDAPVSSQSTAGSAATFVFNNNNNNNNNNKASSANVSSSSSSFLFGTTAAKLSGIIDSGVSGDAATAGAPFEFSFSGVKPRSPLKPRSRDTSLSEAVDPEIKNGTGTAQCGADEDNALYEHDEGEHLLFEPVVPLPDKVEVVTGEENEIVLYQHRCKLYRLSTGAGDVEWKERGLGDIKLLLRPTDAAGPSVDAPAVDAPAVDAPSVDAPAVDGRPQRVRVLMRREPLMKLCLNHRLTELVAFSERDERSVMWSTVDYADGAPSNDVLVVRFKTQSVAAEFLQRVRQIQKCLSRGEAIPMAEQQSQTTSTSTSSSAPTSSTVASGSPECVKTSSSLRTPSSAGSGSVSGGGTGTAAVSRPDTTTAATVSSTSACDSDAEVSVVFERRPTAQQRSAALALQLPASFYLYQDSLRPCPGCRGCRDEMPGEEVNTKPTTIGNFTATSGNPATASSPAPSGSFMFGSATVPATVSVFAPKTTAQPTQPFSFSFSAAASSAFTAASNPDSAANSSPSFGTGVDNSTDSSSKPFQFNFGAGSATTANDSRSSAVPSGLFTVPTTSISGAGGGGIFGGLATMSGPTGSLFGGRTPTVGSAAAAAASGSGFMFGKDSGGGGGGGGGDPSKSAASDNNSTSSGFVFGTAAPQLDFATLSQNTAGQQSAFLSNKGDASFKFCGAGAAVFGGRPSAAAVAAQDNDGSDDQPTTDAGHDPHFEPIVPLPELVDVKTGEEQEDVLFCRRAVLYRFDKGQWKERGRGDIKILRHRQSQATRILMRRDQVHKLACNHRVGADMSLQPLGASANAWVWSAVDYADHEQPKPEMLAVKFKLETSAVEFREVFETAVESAQTLNQNSSGGRIETPSAEHDNDQHEECDVLFEKHCTLYAVDQSSSYELGCGMLRAYHDPEMFCVRVCLLDDASAQQCHTHTITDSHDIQVDNCVVEWSGVDECDADETQATMRRYRVFLNTEDECAVFVQVIVEGGELWRAEVENDATS